MRVPVPDEVRDLILSMAELLMVVVDRDGGDVVRVVTVAVVR